MISTLSGLIFIISVVAFIVILIWGFVKNQHINRKTWLWLLLAVVAIVVYVTTAKTCIKLQNQTQQSNQLTTLSLQN